MNLTETHAKLQRYKKTTVLKFKSEKSNQAGEDSRAGGPASSRPELDVGGQLQQEPHRLWPLTLVGAELAGGRIALFEAELVVGVGVGEHHTLVDWGSTQPVVVGACRG